MGGVPLGSVFLGNSYVILIMTARMGLMKEVAIGDNPWYVSFKLLIIIYWPKGICYSLNEHQKKSTEL